MTIKGRAVAANNALGVRRYVITGAVGTLAAFYGAIRKAVAHYVALPDLPAWEVFLAVVPSFVLWFVAGRAAELEDKLKPRVTVQAF